MILDMQPVTLAEVREIVKGIEEKKNLEDYLKKYCKISKENALSMSEEIRGLNNLKIKNEHIVKVVDLLPKDAEDINKVFNDVSLNEEEINALLEIVRKY